MNTVRMYADDGGNQNDPSPGPAPGGGGDE